MSQSELLHFEAALHALNLDLDLDLDRFLDGPGKRTLAYLEVSSAFAASRVGRMVWA